MKIAALVHGVTMNAGGVTPNTSSDDAAVQVERPNQTNDKAKRDLGGAASSDTKPVKRIRLTPVSSVDDQQQNIKLLTQSSASQNSATTAPAAPVPSVADDEASQLTAVNTNTITVFKVIGRNGHLLYQFSPEFTHQLFDDETLFGYTNLSISVFMTLCFDCYVEVAFDECTLIFALYQVLMMTLILLSFGQAITLLDQQQQSPSQPIQPRVVVDSRKKARRC